MSSVLHNDLVQLGADWLRRQGFPLVATELSVLGVREQPDVLGFRANASVVLEVKVSRQDFRADAQKPERHQGGLGRYRFYLTPAGLLSTQELPPRWGLLEVEDGRVHEVLRPRGNCWGSAIGDWPAFEHEPDLRAEHSALFSIARRLASGESLGAASRRTRRK